MLEAGVPFPVLAMLMNWSAGTMVRLAKRYGHIGQTALRNAVEAISAASSAHAKGTQTPAGPLTFPLT